MMSFGTAVATVYRKSFVFSGRAPRSEFWWFVLFSLLVRFLLGLIGGATLANLWSLANLLPSIALACRRLHDIDRSGWFILMPLIGVPVMLIGYFVSGFLHPLIYLGAVSGMILYLVLILWYALPGTSGDNRFGPDPLNPHGDASVFE